MVVRIERRRLSWLDVDELPEAPWREVMRVKELRGPRGGRILVALLSCGHAFWRRGSQPQTRTRCISCALDAAVAGLERPYSSK